MADKSRIEWTDATWSPIIGCSKVSEGCDSCYAISTVRRGEAMGTAAHMGLTVRPDDGGPFDWTGEVRFLPDRLDQPLRWKRPRKIFVNSLSDLFHIEVLKLGWPGAPEDEERAPLIEILAVMVAARHHAFQVLTKRPQIMARILNDPGVRLRVNAALMRRGFEVMPGGMTDPGFRWPSHIWFGTSIESDRYSFRADHLRDASAGMRFLSLEPLLGPLPSLDLTGIDWVIVGGESGPAARPMHPSWARDLRDRCTGWCSNCRGVGHESPATTTDSSLYGKACRDCLGLQHSIACPNDTDGDGDCAACARTDHSGRHQIKPIPFHFKQWGSWGVGAKPSHNGARVVGSLVLDTGEVLPWDDRPTENLTYVHEHRGLVMSRRAKADTGRTLDGRTWDEEPVWRR